MFVLEFRTQTNICVFCKQNICSVASLELLENGSPPWRLMVPLRWPHLTQDQFQPHCNCGLLLGVVWLSLELISDQILTLRSSGISCV